MRLQLLGRYQSKTSNALKNAKAVAVMDKSMSFGGFGGAVFHEVRHSLYDLQKHPPIINYIYGLGGRDYSPVSCGRSSMTSCKSPKLEVQIRKCAI